MRSFIDTNVLVYADAPDAATKQAIALDLVATHLRSGTGVISTQVLHEFVKAALRKLMLPLDLVRSRVRLYSRFEVVNASPAAVLHGLDILALHQMSFWDSLIVQAARDSGCVQVLTEDLQSNALIAGVRIVNPFAADAGPAPARAAVKAKRR